MLNNKNKIMKKLLGWIKKIIKLNKKLQSEYNDCIKSQKNIIFTFSIDLFSLRYRRYENGNTLFYFKFLIINGHRSLFSIFHCNKKSDICSFLFIHLQNYWSSTPTSSYLFTEINILDFILLKEMIVLNVFEVYLSFTNRLSLINNAVLSLVFNIKHKMPERLQLLFIPFGWLLRLIYGDDGQRFINKKTK